MRDRTRDFFERFLLSYFGLWVSAFTIVFIVVAALIAWTWTMYHLFCVSQNIWMGFLVLTLGLATIIATCVVWWDEGKDECTHVV